MHIFVRLIITDILAGRWRHAKQRVFKAYADMRVGATPAEIRCHKPDDSILLTFDDFGSAEEIADLLRILAEADARAMFFLQGDWAATHGELVQRIAGAGHIIGNHTYSHASLLELPDAAVRNEIAGGPASRWLRPPRGRYNDRIRRIAAELGYAICYWSIDSDDWQGVSAARMREKILMELHPGAVILFHIHGRHTRELLSGLLHDISERGYAVTSMKEPLWPAK